MDRVSSFVVTGAQITLVRTEGEHSSALSPEEEAYALSLHSLRRRLQYQLGRHAASLALTHHTPFEKSSVGRGPRGEPLWPSSICGSIAHTGEIAVAAVAYASEARGVGIDIERRGRSISLEVGKRICKEKEYLWVNEDPTVKNERILMIFSAKEALFKALYPFYKREFSFQDAEIIQCNEETFLAHVYRIDGSDVIEEVMEVKQLHDDAYIIMLTVLPLYKSSLKRS